MLVYGADAAVTEYVCRGLGVRSFGPSCAIGVARDGRLIAGVVYSNFRWPDVEMSIFSESPKWATKYTLFHLFYHPFGVMNCRRVSATTEAGNQPVRAFLERLGFTLEGIRREALPSGDAAHYGLLKADCQWIRGAHEQRRFRSAPGA